MPTKFTLSGSWTQDLNPDTLTQNAGIPSSVLNALKSAPPDSAKILVASLTGPEIDGHFHTFQK